MIRYRLLAPLTFTFLASTVVSSVAEPDQGSGALLTPGSGMNIPDDISESLETIF
jgi:hypothetical protein